MKPTGGTHLDSAMETVQPKTMNSLSRIPAPTVFLVDKLVIDKKNITFNIKYEPRKKFEGNGKDEGLDEVCYALRATAEDATDIFTILLQTAWNALDCSNNYALGLQDSWRTKTNPTNRRLEMERTAKKAVAEMLNERDNRIKSLQEEIRRLREKEYDLEIERLQRQLEEQELEREFVVVLTAEMKNLLDEYEQSDGSATGPKKNKSSTSGLFKKKVHNKIQALSSATLASTTKSAMSALRNFSSMSKLPIRSNTKKLLTAKHLNEHDVNSYDEDRDDFVPPAEDDEIEDDDRDDSARSLSYSTNFNDDIERANSGSDTSCNDQEQPSRKNLEENTVPLTLSSSYGNVELCLFERLVRV